MPTLDADREVLNIAIRFNGTTRAPYLISTPYGAITDERTLSMHVGKTLYRVLGLGKSSSMQPVRLISGPRSKELSSITYELRVADAIEQREDGRSHQILLFLKDVNAGGCHNCHYIFHEIEDALSFLSYAKEHTSSFYADDRFSLS